MPNTTGTVIIIFRQYLCTTYKFNIILLKDQVPGIGLQEQRRGEVMVLLPANHLQLMQTGVQGASKPTLGSIFMQSLCVLLKC